MRIVLRIIPLLFIFAGSLVAQNEPSTAANPLAVLKDEVERVLRDARLPFTDEQEKAIVLMMEDRRRASEELFGELMDFSAGPTQGQDADRLQSAIQWMRNEFLTRLQNYLTPEQLAAWGRSRESTSSPGGDRPRQTERQQQTQYVRINNNAFTTEDASYRAQGNNSSNQPATEVIQRGGAGAFHGAGQVLIKDESLNASRRSYNLGKRVPTIKPPYQERQTSFNVSGPVIPGRLSATVAASYIRAENVESISATLADGSPFGAEVSRPTINNSFSTGGTYQLTDRHSLTYNVGYAPYSKKNQGIGGFTLPERSYTTDGNTWNVEFKQFSAFSAQSIYETRFQISGNRDETIPANTGVRINVLDAFSGGGSQNAAVNNGRNYDFSNLYTRLGERLTIKTGLEGAYRKNRSLSTNNYGGTFTFSSLNAYAGGKPVNYRVTRGLPLQETSQLELSFFMQNDLKLTPKLTLMYGLRYDTQTNLKDPNNFGPRFGFAFAAGRATVIRGGGGLFYNRIPLTFIEIQQRLDGVHQYEIVIDNPSYPDPFIAGTVRNTLPSVRVTDARLVAPYFSVGSISFERTFLTNLLFTASFDLTHETHRARLRNLNAPYDATASVPRSCSSGQSAATCIRPDPTTGNVLILESTAAQINRVFRLSLRKRFGILNASVNYVIQRNYADISPNGPLAGDVSMDNYNMRLDWTALSGALHTVNSSVNAQLPLGIFLTSAMSASGSRSYAITTGKDDNQDTQVNDRPPGVARFSGSGPGSLTFNFNISKAFFFGQGTTGNGRPGAAARKNVNVFANMTNAFNHVNYGTPSGVITSPNFGLSTSGGDPREIEVGLRFQF